jgi:hypothetical protein
MIFTKMPLVEWEKNFKTIKRYHKIEKFIQGIEN